MSAKYQRLPDGYEGNYAALFTRDTWLGEAFNLTVLGIAGGGDVPRLLSVDLCYSNPAC